MTFSPALSLYLLASRLAGPLAGPILRRRMARGKEDPERIGERFGIAGKAHPGGRLIWLHGASVGEAMSMLPLISAIRARTSAAVMVTTGTVTSARRLERLLPEGAFHQYVPVDTCRAVRRFLDHWRPNLAVWVESELWPRLVHQTGRRRIPAALVNARLSGRSARRWRRAPGMVRRLLGVFGKILTQDAETMERLDALGVQSSFAGNLKALVPVEPVDETELSALRASVGERPVWLAASTHPGEEDMVIEAQTRLLSGKVPPLLILAIRHPQRGAEVAALLNAAGLVVARRSRGEVPGPDTQVFLADTLGEMALWYRLAPVTFVAGSLVDKGGHTPFEPVQMHSVVVHGPHVSNFTPAYDALRAEQATLEVRDAQGLADAVGHLLKDVLDRRAIASRALAVHDMLKPNVERLAESLVEMMEHRP